MKVQNLSFEMIYNTCSFVSLLILIMLQNASLETVTSVLCVTSYAYFNDVSFRPHRLAIGTPCVRHNMHRI